MAFGYFPDSPESRVEMYDGNRRRTLGESIGETACEAHYVGHPADRGQFDGDERWMLRDRATADFTAPRASRPDDATVS